MQDKDNKYKKNTLKRFENRVKVRHSVLIVMILALCIILISTIGVTPKDADALSNTQSPYPVMNPQVLPPSKPGESPLITTLNGRTVALDPGHGGVDPGCFVDDAFEDDINFAIGLKVKAYLEELGYCVIMTREEDVTVSISDRIEFANNSEADLLISIHQNALEDDTVTNGIETWYNKKANEQNELLAECIQQETIAETGAVDRGLRPDKSLMITKKAAMPSCLIETGFVTSSDERSKLMDEAYRESIARGIVAGVEQFFERLSEDDS